MSLILPMLTNGGGGGAPPATITFVTSEANTSASSSRMDFTGVSMGAAATGRYILAGLSLGSASGLSGNISMDAIGGVTPTLLGQYEDGDNIHAFFILFLETGTSGDFDFDFSVSNDANRAALTVWNVFGLVDASAPTDTSQMPSGTTGSASGTIDVEAAGLVAAVGGTAQNSTSSLAWTGLDEDSDIDVGGRRYGSASREFSTAATGHSISIADSPSSDRLGAFAVALR